jgi:peroxiredoxin
MASLETPVCDFGAPAPDFTLPGVDGRIWTRDDCRGEKGLLVMFICNHCPYVKAVRERIVRDVRELQALGIGCVGIMSNDPADYPEDSFENMQRIAEELGFPFPYLLDETQEVARPTGPSAPRISSATTGPWHSSTAAGSTRAARRPPPRACGATSSRPCARSPRPARARGADPEHGLLDQVEGGLSRLGGSGRGGVIGPGAEYSDLIKRVFAGISQF